MVKSLAGTFFAFLPLALSAGCATVWGFDDLTPGDLDAAVGTPESDGRADARASDATSSDARGDDDSSPPGADAAPHEGGAVSLDAAADGDGPTYDCTPGSCPNGCCDPKGVCHPVGETATCGTGGAACQDCSTTKASCFPQYTPCCISTGSTAGKCGCLFTFSCN